MYLNYYETYIDITITHTYVFILSAHITLEILTSVSHIRRAVILSGGGGGLFSIQGGISGVCTPAYPQNGE